MMKPDRSFRLVKVELAALAAVLKVYLQGTDVLSGMYKD